MPNPDLKDALNSFYSDIAAIETGDSVSVGSNEEAKIETESVEVKKKKNKTKV